MTVGRAEYPIIGIKEEGAHMAVRLIEQPIARPISDRLEERKKAAFKAQLRLIGKRPLSEGKLSPGGDVLSLFFLEATYWGGRNKRKGTKQDTAFFEKINTRMRH